jgi:hypothetical protein
MEKRRRILYVFFWVFPRRQIKFCRRFGTLCQVHLQRLDELNLTPGKYPKENIQVSEHGKNLKSGEEFIYKIKIIFFRFPGLLFKDIEIFQECINMMRRGRLGIGEHKHIILVYFHLRQHNAEVYECVYCNALKVMLRKK